MTSSYEIDSTTRQVRYAVRGRLRLDRTRAFLARVAADPAFESGFAFLADCRALEDDPTAAYVRGFARELRNRASVFGPCRWALVFSTPAGFSAARLCSRLTPGTGVEFAAFASPSEAAAWLAAGRGPRSRAG